MTVYVCEPDFESILCGVYDAWTVSYTHLTLPTKLEV